MAKGYVIVLESGKIGNGGFGNESYAAFTKEAAIASFPAVAKKFETDEEALSIREITGEVEFVTDIPINFDRNRV